MAGGLVLGFDSRFERSRWLLLFLILVSIAVSVFIADEANERGAAAAVGAAALVAVLTKRQWWSTNSVGRVFIYALFAMVGAVSLILGVVVFSTSIAAEVPVGPAFFWLLGVGAAVIGIVDWRASTVHQP